MTDTTIVTADIDPTRRRLDFYRLAAECAVEGWLTGFAENALAAERDRSPLDDPCRAWSDDDLEGIVRRVYAEHRRRSRAEADDTAVAS